MFASKTDLASLKTKVDDLDGDKTKTVPVNLGKLCNSVNNGVVKKTLYNQLVTKVNAIDTKTPSTSRLVTKRRYDSDKQALEKKIEDGYKKIPNITGQINNTKITEIEKKIPVVTGIVNTAAFSTKATEAENKVPGITNLLTKAALNTKAT